MRISSIDIGTNTVLLLIADIDDNGEVVPVVEEQQIPRLGRSVDATGRLSHEGIGRVCDVVEHYVKLSRTLNSQSLTLVATSAVRDSRNSNDISEAIHARTGLILEILSGVEEARWTYIGGCSNARNPIRPAAVLDIGGGSTELTYPSPSRSNGDNQLMSHSMQIGAVRIRERYFKHDPPMTDEIQSARRLIVEVLSEIQNPGFAGYDLIGVAGTATSLSCLHLNLETFDSAKVENSYLSLETIGSWNNKLLKMTATEIRSLSSVVEGRSDILSAGVLILSELMQHFGFKGMRTSTRGLRYGIALREWQRQSGRTA